MGLYTIPTADLFDTFTKTLGVGYEYMTVFTSLVVGWAQDIRELKGDKDRLVLTADKGIAMVVMGR